MAGNSINATTMWTPQGGFGNYGQQLMDQAPQRQEFLVANPNYNPNDPYSGPEMIQDPTATGTPGASTYTGANGLTTRGVMNPFGLTQNNAAMGYNGVAPAPTAPTTQPPAATPPPPAAAPTTAPATAPDNRPPDQRGYEGTYNSQTGMTGYATPNGQFMMDEAGNWFDQGGTPVDFDQTGGQPSTQQAASNPNVMTGGGTQAAASTFMVNGRLVNYNGEPVTPDGKPIGGGGAGGGNPADPYYRDVTSSSIDPKTGKQRFDPTNPYQFGTEQTAQDLASRYGGSAYGINFEGPGMGLSRAQQQIRLPNGQSVNAGLAAQALGRPEYGGGAPGSYGEYASGLTGNTQGIGYDAWARSQPGFKENPRLANTGPGVGNQYMKESPEATKAQYNNSQAYQQQGQQYQQQQYQPQYPQNSYQGGGYGQQQLQGGQQAQPYQGGGGTYQYPQNNYGGYGRSTGSWGSGGGNTRQGGYQGQSGYGQGQAYGGGYSYGQQQQQESPQRKSGGYGQYGSKQPQQQPQGGAPDNPYRIKLPYSPANSF